LTVANAGTHALVKSAGRTFWMISAALCLVDVSLLLPDFMNGKIDFSTFLKKACLKIAGTAISVGAAGLGSTIGAAIGTLFCPGIGTACGSIIGALLAGVITSYSVDKAFEKYFFKEIELSL
jgi:hypothetical protein